MALKSILIFLYMYLYGEKQMKKYFYVFITLYSCLFAGGGSEMGGGAEAAGDRDTKTAAGDGGTVSP